MKRLPPLASFILFILLCATSAYWVLQLWRAQIRPMAAPAAAPSSPLALDAAASLFGGRPAAMGVASNYELRGVVVDRSGRESVAILSADGKPAQAVGLNVEFQPGVIIQEVHPLYILLSEGGVIKRVALPETSTLQSFPANPNLGANLGAIPMRPSPNGSPSFQGGAQIQMTPSSSARQAPSSTPPASSVGSSSANQNSLSGMLPPPVQPGSTNSSNMPSNPPPETQ